MDVIIGAGISGLSYAAATPNDYLVVEADGEIGGYCKTIYQDGFIWDYSGHFFHFQHPELRDYVMQQIAEDEMLTVAKHTQILYGDRHIDFPFQMNIHQLPQEEFIDCLYDLFTAEQKTDFGSFKDMIYTKFGKSISEKFLIPYNTKLYATDLDRLDVDAMGRFFPYADKEQIVKNFRHPEGHSYNASFLYPKAGCMRIVNSVASNVDTERISLNERMLSIDTENHNVVTSKRTLHYDNLISTIPFPKLLDACSMDYDRSVYSWNKVLVFNLGFDSKGPEKVNSWLYVPESKYVFYRVGFYDNILGQDRTSLYVEIGFGKDEEVGDIDALLKRTLNDLQAAGIVTFEQKLVSHNCVIMNPAYVHITQRSEADKKVQMKRLADKNIYSIGRYGEWKYCSLEDNMYDAFMLSKSIQNSK